MEVQRRNFVNGAWLLRNSSLSNIKGDSTVFSMSFAYISDILKTKNIRFINLHNIGIYLLTDVPGGAIRRNNVPDEIIQTADRMKILTAIQWQPPVYANITDLLIDFNHRGYIKLSEMILPENKAN
jgi:hypothetical protein